MTVQLCTPQQSASIQVQIFHLNSVHLGMQLYCICTCQPKLLDFFQQVNTFNSTAPHTALVYLMINRFVNISTEIQTPTVKDHAGLER